MAQGHFWAYDSSLCALKGQKPQRLSDWTPSLCPVEKQKGAGAVARLLLVSDKLLPIVTVLGEMLLTSCYKVKIATDRKIFKSEKVLILNDKLFYTYVN